MYLVACGATGLGDWIWETDNGRPFGMSTARLSRFELECFSRLEWCLEERLSLSDEEECLDDDDLEEDLCEDFSEGTSRMFRVRPVVGSVVDDCAGSWETWYPSMM